jgi:hypothetical protein
MFTFLFPAHLFIVEEDRDGDNNAIIDTINYICFGLSYYFICAAIKYFQLRSYTCYVGDLLWKSLTPGQESLEILTIVSTIISSVAVIIMLRELFLKLDAGLQRLKDELKEKNEYIANLENVINTRT